MSDAQLEEHELTIKLLKLDVIHLREERDHWRTKFMEVDESSVKALLFTALICLPLGAVIGVMLYNFFGGMV